MKRLEHFQRKWASVLRPKMRQNTKIACAAVLASLALAGCGHSDSANAPASADNVEMPAEEAMSGVTAAPSADASATATDVGTAGPDSTAAGSSAPTVAASAASSAGN